MAYEVFGGKKDLLNMVGFINAFLMSPLKFEAFDKADLLNPQRALERQSTLKTKTVLKDLFFTEGTLIFNKRVIIDVHGTVNGELAFEYLGKKVNFSTPEEFAAELGHFFLAHKMDVQFIDLLMCNGDSITNRMFEGLKSAGLKNFVLRSFRVLVNAPLVEDERIIEVLSQKTDKAYNIDVSDYVLRGEMPEEMPADEVLTFSFGSPEAIIPPALTAGICGTGS